MVVDTSSVCLDEIAAALAQPEPLIDLARVALLCGCALQPTLEVDRYLARLDWYAARASALVGPAPAAESASNAIRAVLFDEEEFAGDETDYYSVLNCILQKVMDRRRGVPITLSIVYLAVARRMGLNVVGIGLPLHFVVRHVEPGNGLLVDPFYGGAIVTPEQCQSRVEQAYGGPVEFDASYLQPMGVRGMLYRMLNNLKQGYVRLQDYHRAGMVVEQMLVVMPEQTQEVRDRGLLLLQEHRLTDGIRYLCQYLNEHPDARDADIVRGKLIKACERRGMRN